MAKVFIGLGSNQGDSYDNIVKALKQLQSNPKIFIENLSTFHKTKPIGGPPQGDYLNAVAKITTELEPKELLKATAAIEEKLGRIREVKNGPRTIDLDILLYDDKKINEPELTIPHPRMKERDFVLKPLYEIAPEFKDRLTQS